MGGLKLSFMVSMAMVVITAMQFHGTVARTTHVVGGAVGWTVPPIGPFTYPIWTALRTITVGDDLLFNFTTGSHTVAEVSPAAYWSCNTTTNPITLITISPATLTLTTLGKHYYICTVGTHCLFGQKLAINVVAGNTTLPVNNN